MNTFLRALISEPRPRSIPAPGWKDVAFAGVVGVLEALTHVLFYWDYHHSWLGPIQLLIGVAGLSLLIVRRRYPLTCAGLALVILIGSDLLGNALLFAAPALYLVIQILMYNLGRWGSGRAIVAGAIFPTLFALPIQVPRTLEPFSGWTGVSGTGSWVTSVALVISLIVNLAITYIFPLGLGYFIRYLKDANKRDIEKAREAERLDMARELHDSVAHHVTAIAVQANAGQSIASTRPEEAIARLASIKKESTEVLSDMRRIVGSLRDEDDLGLALPIETPTTTSGIERLMALVDEDTSLPPVTVTVTGNPENVPELVANGLYRVVQESITNAKRHSAGATFIEVNLAIDDEIASVRITNDGDVVSAPTTGGFGIIGIIERVTLLGGVATAIPRHDGGWLVEAEIPIDEV